VDSGKCVVLFHWLGLAAPGLLWVRVWENWLRWSVALPNQQIDRMRKLLNINRLAEKMDRRPVARGYELEMGVQTGDWRQKGVKKKVKKKLKNS